MFKYTDREGKLQSVDSTGDIARCLPPLLDAIGWSGDSSSLLVEALPHNVSRITLTELINAMANLKYKNQITKTTLGEISSDQTPCLFIPEKGDAKVLIKGSKKFLFAFDSTDLKYTQIEKSNCKGLAVQFESMELKSDGLTQTQKDWFYKLMSRFGSVFFQVFTLTFAVSLLALAYPLFVMSIYDKILVSESTYSLGSWVVGIIIFIAANTGFAFIRSQYMNFFSLRIGNVIGFQVLRRLLFLPSRYTEVVSLGDQISRFKDFEGLRDFFAGKGPIAVLELLFILLMIGCMFLIGGSIGFIPIASIILFVIFGFIITPYLRRANESASEAYSKRQQFLMEMIPELRALKYTSATKVWIERYKPIAKAAALSFNKAATINSIISVFSQTLITGSGIATMGLGVYLIMEDKMSSGALIASIILIWRILAPLNTVFSVFTQMEQIKKSITQLDHLMNLPLESKPESGIVMNQDLMGKVEFSNVSIRYSAEAQPALLGVNFVANKGHAVTIIGHTGSGKSTIFKLLLGMYLPQAGRIFLDDMNIRQMDPVALRRSIAYSPNEDQFYHGTIAQNLLMVKPSATFDELEVAAEKAGVLDEILAMPGGFSAKIKESNILHFSTSFKKGMSLARVFLKDCGIILLDNPDKGLDDKQQEKVFNSLKALQGKSTVIMITENENLFKLSNSMIWLEQGRVRMGGDPKKIKAAYLQYLSS